MRRACLIPARIGSTRFPRKPLQEINGRPMIGHVACNALEAFGSGNVFVVTDNKEIEAVAIEVGARAIIVDQECHSGTDRIAIASLEIKGVDWIYNVQGDEPALEPLVMRKFVDRTEAGQESVTNAMKHERDVLRLESPNSIKIVTDRDKRLLFASRTPIPTGYNKHGALTQVCIYGFRPEALEKYVAWGRREGSYEASENIEILRFLEQGEQVRMIQVETDSHPVDVPSDVAIVSGILKSRAQL